MLSKGGCPKTALSIKDALEALEGDGSCLYCLPCRVATSGLIRYQKK